jgi:phage baseplate assembly protein W
MTPWPSDDLWPSETLYPGPIGEVRPRNPDERIIPKLTVPIRMGAVGLSTVEQDSIDEISACAYAVIATPLESRLEEPEFGISDPTFDELPLDLSEWYQAIAGWEPRASITTEQEVVDVLDSVNVKVAAQ